MMKFKNKAYLIISLFSFFLLPQFVLSQTSEIESLEKQLENSSKKKKVEILIKLQSKYFNKNNSATIRYGKLAIKLADLLKMDSAYFKASYYIIRTYLNTNEVDSAYIFARKHLEKAEKLNFEKDIAFASHAIGNYYLAGENFQQALSYFQHALELREKIMDTSGISSSSNNIGKVYFSINQYNLALKYFKRSQDINLLLKDTNSMAVSFNNLGAVYSETQQYDTALYYLNKAIVIRKKLKDIEGIYTCYNNIGAIYADQKINKVALAYYDSAYSYLKTSDNKWDEANTLYNTGSIYMELEDYAKAYQYFQNAMDIAQKNRINSMMLNGYEYMASYYDAIKDYKNAYKYQVIYTNFKDSIFNENFTNEMQSVKAKFESEKQKRELAEKEVEIKQSKQQIVYQRFVIAGFVFIIFFILFLTVMFYRMVKEKKKFNDLLSHQYAEITQQKEEIETQSEQMELINQELEELSVIARETDNAIAIIDANLDIVWINNGFNKIYGYDFDEFVEVRGKNLLGTSGNENIKNIINVCLSQKTSISYESLNKTKEGKDLWLQTTLTPIFNSSDNLQKIIAIESDITALKNAENQIKQQNEQIKGSIRYAQTIQRTILPSNQIIKQYFENFIIYLPKDIVSGDFYWFSMVNSASGKEKFILALVDCTGHGVPGAFMSLIADRLLNEIVNGKKIIEPSQIIKKLDDKIIKALQQDTSENADGMDISICLIDKENNLLTFSAAKQSIIVCLPNEENIIEIKGARKSIGGIKSPTNHEEFNDISYKYEKDTIIYMFSDGLSDLNNYERKRFGSQKFAKIIAVIKNEPLSEQQHILLDEISEFQGKTEQRDDLTIFALKI